jgi:hypothetical protein
MVPPMNIGGERARKSSEISSLGKFHVPEKHPLASLFCYPSSIIIQNLPLLNILIYLYLLKMGIKKNYGSFVNNVE